MKFSISKKRGDNISQELIGLFFEDINFAADGGLYAEMIENRSFEAQDAFGTPGNFYTLEDPGYGWSLFSNDVSQPCLQFVTGDPVSAVNPHYLRITTFKEGQGVKNKAYDGIALKKGMTYRISFYARCVSYEGNEFCVQIIKNGTIYAQTAVKAVRALPYIPFTDTTIEIPAEIEDVEKILPGYGEYLEKNDGTRCRRNDWIYYEAVLTSECDVCGGDFVLTLAEPGIVEFDLISMMPGDAVAGIFRKDLFEALKELNPGFIRFPGGCIVEGISLSNRYQWKNTVGPVKDRKVIPNLWAFHSDRTIKDINAQQPDSHYGQSYGLGFYEFFLLCELLGAKPLPVINIGCACQARSTEIVASDDPAFAEYIQNALDLIEFANGSTDSKWGALRASMGHPDSFGLDMIGIGNEQWETRYFDLYHRYEMFAEAILTKYPDMRLIGTEGPVVDLPLVKEAWEFYRNGQEKNDHFCYASDEHYYVSPEWMYGNIDFYNDYPGNVGVFAGEYAAHTADKENNMEAALAEAAFLTGIEKNAGVVKLASYAPLFARIGHSQWKPDMIWFDDQSVYLTPSYQVQKMYAANLGDFTIPMGGNEVLFREQKVYLSLSGKENGELIIKAVNVGDKDFLLELTDESGRSYQSKTLAKIQCLVSAGAKMDGLPEPSEIMESAVQIDGQLTLPAKSFSVIRIE